MSRRNLCTSIGVMTHWVVAIQGLFNVGQSGELGMRAELQRIVVNCCMGISL